MADGLSGPEIKELLERERAGTLSPEAQQAIGALRDAGKFPKAMTAVRAALGRVTETVTPAVPLSGTPAMEMGGRRGSLMPQTPESIVGDEQSYRMAQESVAKTLVPQNEIELGMILGTAGAGMAARALGAGRLASAGARVLGGALGGEAGGQVAGEPTGTGAVIGGTSTLAGEGVGFLAGKVTRSASPAAVAKKDAARLGEVIEEVVPTLKGKRTGVDLDRMVYDPQAGKFPLGDFYDRMITTADNAIGKRDIKVPALGGWMSLGEAVEALKRVGHAGFAGKGDPGSRTIAGKETRELFTAAIKEIEGELRRLDPSEAALKAFQSGRREYSLGVAFIDLLRKSDAFLRGPNRVDVDMAKVQTYLAKNRSKYISRLTPTEFQDLVQAVYRGGPIGSRDVVGRAMGPADALSQMGRSGGGTGTVAVLGPRTLLPGVGNQYTGRPPFTLPDSAQVGLDYILQRAGGAALRPEE